MLVELKPEAASQEISVDNSQKAKQKQISHKTQLDYSLAAQGTWHRTPTIRSAVLIAILFNMARNGKKNPKCPLIDELIKKM